MFKNKLLTVSNDGNYLALCNAEGVLDILDTNSNVLEHRFHPGEYLSSEVTCLKISTVSYLKNFKGKKKKNVQPFRKAKMLVALGTVEGVIIIYDPVKPEVTGKLVHASTYSVTDLCWESTHNLVSIGDNKKLLIWNVENNTKLCSLDISETKSLCILSDNHYITANINLQYLSYDPQTGKTEGYTIPGHKSCITQLIPIFIKEKDASYFLSAAENDRFVYVWAVKSELREPIGSFMVKDIVRSISCVTLSESSILLTVTTQKGILRLFDYHLNGSKNTTPIRFDKSLRIENSIRNSGPLTIMSAAFVSTSVLLVVYGTELSPRIETIKVDSITKETILSREDPSLCARNKDSNLVKNITPHVPANAVHLMPTQMNPEEIKEVNGKRKKGAELNLPVKELPGVPDSRPLDNYVHLLVQALHSKDSSHLNSVLTKGDDEEIINNTVRRLPVSYVVPFLQYLQEVITGKGLKNLTCINWIKSVLFLHMSHLSSIPEKETLLQPFYNVFAARTASFIAVSKLHARIGLLLTQVKNRHENTTQSATEAQSEALYKYKEESSDEEDIRLEMDGGGPSESEDIWDDWMEDEEEEEEEEMDVEESKEKKRVEKRKTSSRKEDFIALNDSEDDDSGDENEDADEGDDSQSASESE